MRCADVGCYLLVTKLKFYLCSVAIYLILIYLDFFYLDSADGVDILARAFCSMGCV